MAYSKANFQDHDNAETGNLGRPPTMAPADQAAHQHESIVLHQQDTLGQCYSSATVSAMARFLGRNDDNEQLLPSDQASVVVLPKAKLMNVLKAGSDTPLDEASAALALLCEAGQYDAVVQYGKPLLKAASAAVPFSPLGAGKHPPIPHLEHLASDLALSIALAHISLAGGGGGGGGGGAGTSGGGVLLTAGGSGAGSSASSGEFAGLEEVHAHLEAALQVLERHSVAAPLQQEVGYCLQGVAAAFAEEVFHSSSPVTAPPSAQLPAASGTGAVPSSAGGGGGGSLQSSAGGPGAAAAAGGHPTAASGASADDAAARRAKAVSLLRSVLWRSAAQSHTNGGANGNGSNLNRLHQQSERHADGPAAQGGAMPPAAAVGPSPVAAEVGAAPPAMASTGGGSGLVLMLTPDERKELMAPLRGVMTAAEHIALYGPVASGQKPYGAVKLSDEELYDLAIAHLAQGVSTGWPQHVLQALSYFERVAQQQLQQQGSSAADEAASRGCGGGSSAEAAADVSFERRVCEALLGRRTSATGPADRPRPAPGAAPSSPLQPRPASGGRAAEGGAGGSVSSGAPLPYSFSGDEWYDDGDETALLRRLEAQLLLAAGDGGAAGAAVAAPGPLEGAVSFSVNERSLGSEYDDDYDVSAAEADRGPAASAPSAGFVAGSAAGPGSPADASARARKARGGPAAPQSSAGGRAWPHLSGHDVALQYGWAESWLELSVMPCFPETAAAGSVSLARWFADPRVILFNKLLAVRSGEVQVTAALGSAAAHASDASRQRLWQLWQAAAQAVSSARGQAQPQTAAAAVTTGATTTPEAAAATAAADGGAKGGGGGGTAAPLAAGLLAQSRAALQDVGPRAAAAASAVAAAAAAVGSAAASSPRAVAQAAGWMAPFGLARWGTAGRPAGSGGGGDGATAVAVKATSWITAAGGTAEPVTAAGGANGDAAGAVGHAGDGSGGSVGQSQQQQPHQHQQQQQSMSPKTNNVVPFPGGGAAAGGGGSGPVTAAAARLPAPPPPVPAAPPVGGGLVDVALAAPPAGGGGSAAAIAADEGAEPDGAAAAAAGALWAPDAEGHLRPRPRMVARAVQQAAAAAAGIKERVAALPSGPVRDWATIALDPAAADEATSREAVRRVAAVAAQAMCLGALAAYVGNRIVASGALQAAAASGYDAAAAVAAPTVDASRAQMAAAAQVVARWLDGAGVGSLALEALGQWPPLGGAGAGQRAEMLPAGVEGVTRLAEQYGRRAELDETGAAALLRGWAAARAAAPALADPRDRSELLSGLLRGRALRVARAEADRNARVGRRMQLQRVDVELQQLKARTPAAGVAAEVVVAATVVTAGTETSRAAPLPLSYCTRERLALTFRREVTGGSAAGSAGSSMWVWRLVDIRDVPPAPY